MTKTNIPKGWYRHPNGGGLVQDTAFVAKIAYVGPDAEVLGNAWVFGNAKVFGNARVFGNIEVSDNAKVFDNARVFGNAKVFGNVEVSGNARVFGNAWVSGNARVLDDAKVFGNARVNRGNHTVSPLIIQGTRDTLCYLGEDWVAIGCEEHPISEWLEDYREIGKEHRYSESEVEEYRRFLGIAADWIAERE